MSWTVSSFSFNENTNVVQSKMFNSIYKSRTFDLTRMFVPL